MNSCAAVIGVVAAAAISLAGSLSYQCLLAGDEIVLRSDDQICVARGQELINRSSREQQ